MDRGLLALVQRMSALESDDTESLNELLREVGESDGQSYVDRKLTSAISREDSDDLGFALIVAFRFGVNAHVVEELKRIAFEEWHHSHESVSTLLEESGDDDVLDTLYEYAHWAPSDLDEIDSSALFSKATWAVWRLAGDLHRVLDDAPTAEMRDLAVDLLNKPRRQ